MGIKIVNLSKRETIASTTGNSGIGKMVVESSRWMRARNKLIGAVGYDTCDHYALEDAESGKKIAEVILL